MAAGTVAALACLYRPAGVQRSRSVGSSASISRRRLVPHRQCCSRRSGRRVGCHHTDGCEQQVRTHSSPQYRRPHEAVKMSASNTSPKTARRRGYHEDCLDRTCRCDRRRKRSRAAVPPLGAYRRGLASGYEAALSGGFRWAFPLCGAVASGVLCSAAAGRSCCATHRARRRRSPRRWTACRRIRGCRRARSPAPPAMWRDRRRSARAGGYAHRAARQADRQAATSSTRPGWRGPLRRSATSERLRWWRALCAPVRLDQASVRHPAQGTGAIRSAWCSTSPMQPPLASASKSRQVPRRSPATWTAGLPRVP